MKIEPVALAERIEAWQKRLASLGVAHYEIERVTITEGEDSTRAAHVQCWKKYDRCVFVFRQEFLDDATADELDQVILHEWIHVAMRDFDEVLEQVEPWMPKATYEMWENVVEHEREGVVDRVATALFYAFRRRLPRFSP